MNLDLSRIEDLLGTAIVRSEKLAGGDLGGATKLTCSDGRNLVGKTGPMVEREANMLRAIAETGAPAPKVLASEDGLLVMEYVEPKPIGDRWNALAKTLQQLHQPSAEPYGWPDDYAFGSVDIVNSRASDWVEFWAENRLLCHAQHIAPDLAYRIDELAKSLADILPSSPPASLLHGDLWGGNIIWSGDSAVLIDPACYIGHREVDWAMPTLFDHPPDELFERLDPETGWRERQSIYRLWPWLVHLRLFGDTYRGAVERELATLGF